MKKKSLILIAGCLMAFSIYVKSQHSVSVFESVLFYDGYNTLEKLADEIEPAPDGVYRLKTSLITTKLSEEQLNLLNGSIQLDVLVQAACDNYDRLGHVNIAFVPKDCDMYDPAYTQRIEIARFVTPFMNKNREPDIVPYNYDISYLQYLFQDQNVREEFNFWIELEIFGVPYAANTQVAGCSGRSDVFYGTLWFTATEAASTLENDHVFIPLFMQNKFNNYQTGATDTIGQTIKNKLFTIEQDLNDAHLVLITSNHGANSGGEEYNRRWHYVYLNQEEILRYKPGRTSCEPFRVYNTQANGIYGYYPKTDEQWQAFSNWCPGDVIDNRIINLGALTAGDYLFTITVPEARFVGQEGNFPLSLYLQGKTAGTLVGIKETATEQDYVFIYPNPVENSFSIYASEMVKSVIIHSITGKQIIQKNKVSTVDLSSVSSGIYFVSVELTNGYRSVTKVIKQ